MKECNIASDSPNDLVSVCPQVDPYPIIGRGPSNLLKLRIDFFLMQNRHIKYLWKESSQIYELASFMEINAILKLSTIILLHYELCGMNFLHSA